VRRALAWFAPGLLAACQQPPKGTAVRATAKSTVVAIPDSAEQVAFGMRTVLTNKGVATGVLLSDTALFYDQGGRIELRRVNTTFFSSTGARDGTLTSRTGNYNARLARLEARGDVVLIRLDGRRLETQQLVYDQARNEVFSDSAFVFTDKGRQMTGVGFVSDPRLTTFRVLRNAKGTTTVQLPKR
jgi:LPS export ABC transporter protein LptC